MSVIFLLIAHESSSGWQYYCSARRNRLRLISQSDDGNVKIGSSLVLYLYGVRKTGLMEKLCESWPRLIRAFNHWDIGDSVRDVCANHFGSDRFYFWTCSTLMVIKSLAGYDHALVATNSKLRGTAAARNVCTSQVCAAKLSIPLIWRLWCRTAVSWCKRLQLLWNFVPAPSRVMARVSPPLV